MSFDALLMGGRAPRKTDRRFLFICLLSTGSAGGAMELSQLETFLAVAEERSFSKAAVRLHRTQPAISQVIRKLEASIGEPLFDRAARDGSLTASGELLRDY